MSGNLPCGPRCVRFSLDDGRELELRPPRVEDAARLAEAVAESLPELEPYMPWATEDNARVEKQFARLIDAFAKYLRGEEYIFHAYEGDELVGTIGLHRHPRWGPSVVEVGYWVRSSCAGRGLCTALTRAVVVLAFDYLAAERVEISHAENNPGSRRVIEKCGFVQECVMRNVLGTRTPAMVAAPGSSPHAVIYALTRADALPEVALTIDLFDGAAPPAQP